MIPTFGMLLGGIIAGIFNPGEKLISGTQHFAAGVVFAAVAIELLPHLGQGTNIWAMTIGFLAGLITMIGIKLLTEAIGHTHGGQSATPWGLISGVGIDLFIDGVLIGIAFLVGKQGGLLITFALAIEVLFLGLSSAATLSGKQFNKLNTILIVFGLGLLLPIGSVGGASLLQSLPPIYTSALISFGVAALLYLVTEELLTEAHEVEDTPLITSSFFIGFLVILILEHMSA
ncbi:ZIP family metal transporter [Legionella sp. W05-934-2]|uniref:ZIP family metal transporter n=1 Tax=Legionella sp. W05-934-2 TaxID=1198649 RepID=UPI003461BBDF